MGIREELVSSAIQFLQDPSVASSSVENRISFLRSKNLTQEEIDASLSRASGAPLAPVASYPAAPYPSPAPSGAPYYQPYGQQAWQAPPRPAPRRDWRDWFIMATVVGGVSYGLFSLGKRYVYPLIAPPTPERLEQDKKSIEEQFDRAFGLVEQLAKDTEELKNAEKERTERLDNALSELESVMSELKSANRRREDDGQRIRDEVQSLKDAIPKALNNQKDLTDNRLREINTELTSLKTLVSQRMTNGTSSTPTSSSFLRPSNGNVQSTPAESSAAEPAASATTDTSAGDRPKSPARMGAGKAGNTLNGSTSQKASIPAWQLAMSKGASEGSSTTPNGAEVASVQSEAGSSS